MPSEYKFDFDAVLGRIKQAMGFATDAQVAEFIGLSASGLGNRKRSGSIPFEGICQACAARGVNIDWVLTGQGVPRGREALLYSRTESYEAADLMREITSALWLALEDDGFAEREPALLSDVEVRAAIAALIYQRCATIEDHDERVAAARNEVEAFAYASKLSAVSARGSDGSA